MTSETKIQQAALSSSCVKTPLHYYAPRHVLEEAKGIGLSDSKTIRYNYKVRIYLKNINVEIYDLFFRQFLGIFSFVLNFSSAMSSVCLSQKRNYSVTNHELSLFMEASLLACV